MYKNKPELTYKGYMSRKDIISEAQQYVDYQMNDDDERDFPFKTAMSTLIAEKYVTKKWSTFCITDSGSTIIYSSLVFEKPLNSHFIKWLTEMEAEAAAYKSNKQSTITKLLNLFKRFPIGLASAKDCMDFYSIFNIDDGMSLQWTKEILKEFDKKLEQNDEISSHKSDSDDEDVEEELVKKTDQVDIQTGKKTKTQDAKKKLFD